MRSKTFFMLAIGIAFQFVCETNLFHHNGLRRFIRAKISQARGPPQFQENALRVKNRSQNCRRVPGHSRSNSRNSASDSRNTNFHSQHLTTWAIQKPQLSEQLPERFPKLIGNPHEGFHLPLRSRNTTKIIVKRERNNNKKQQKHQNTEESTKTRKISFHKADASHAGGMSGNLPGHLRDISRTTPGELRDISGSTLGQLRYIVGTTLTN